MRFAFVCLLACLPGSAGAGENLLTNGGFEGEFGGDGIARGWADNSSWADLDVAYRREAANPHSGAACQRTTCRRLTDGAFQLIPTTGIALRKGATYRVRAWLRGSAGTAAVQLRQAPSPYQLYVEKGLPLRREWRQAEYLWTSTVDDPSARLMLRFTHTGDVWVDDVSVEELTPEEAQRLAGPPERGNLLHNGQLDLGLANWLLSHGCDTWHEASLSIEQGPSGPCLKLDVPEGVSTTLSSDAVPITAGLPVAASCRIRSSAQMAVGFGSRFSQAWPQVTPEWQTLRATGTAGFGPEPYDALHLHVTGPAALWLDDVQLRQDGQAAGERLRAAIIPDRHPLSLYHDGEAPVLHLLSAAPPEGRPPALTWRVEDFRAKARLSGKWAPGAGRQEKRIPAGGLPRGWYRATVTWDDGGRPRRNESTFCILPPAERRGEARTSPFGAHFAVDPSGLKIARAVGIRWLRLHPPNHTKWRVVEAKQGEWTWRDEPIRIARQAGLELCGSLDRIPRWASPAPPDTFDAFYTGWAAWVPRSWDEWERYVAETVRRYRKDIHVWEVWNEPNLDDWLVPPPGQTRAQAYVEMLRHTYPVVKREDPAATVIGGCVAGALRGKSPARQFAEAVIDGGGLQWMDQFSFHDYIVASIDEGDDPVEAWLPRLRVKMRAAGKEVPILNSEGGFANPGASLTYRPCDPGRVPPHKMAPWLVRQYVAQMAQGVRQFYFYNVFIDGSPVTLDWEGFLEGDGQPRPNVAAYAVMTWLLDGADFARTDRPTKDAWAHRFRGPKGSVAVAWTRAGARATLAVPPGSRVYTLMGAPVTVRPGRRLALTDVPVYVVQ